MGSIVDFIGAPEMTALFLDNPASFVRNGGLVNLANMASDHPLSVTFARAMVPFVAPTAEAVAAEVSRWSTPPRRVLDVAAGHGVFGIAGVWENWRDPASGEWVRTFASRHRPGELARLMYSRPDACDPCA